MTPWHELALWQKIRVVAKAISLTGLAFCALILAGLIVVAGCDPTSHCTHGDAGKVLRSYERCEQSQRCLMTPDMYRNKERLESICAGVPRE